MKVGYLRIRFFVFLIAFAMFFSSLSSMITPGDSFLGRVYAADVSDKIDVSVSVDPNGPFEANQYISIIVDFSANKGDSADYVNGGDYFEIKWESADPNVRFDAFTSTSFDLFDKNGKALASAEINKVGAKVTFKDTVNDLHDISGTLYINGMVINNNDKEDDDSIVTVRINGEAKTDLIIHPGGADVGTIGVFKKTGYTTTLDDGTPLFQWTLMINGEYKEDFTGKLKITDSLKGKGHIFVGDTDKTASYYIRVTDKDDQQITNHEELNGKDVYGYRKTTGYYYGEARAERWANHTNKFVIDFSGTTTMEQYLEDISFSPESETMTINVPSNNVNGKFIEIVYYTVPIEEHDVDNGKYENDALLEYSDSTNPTAKEDWSDDIYYQNSGGKITGVPNESFQIVKFEKGTTTPISNVTFKIKRKDGQPFRDGNFEKTAITNEKGEALITNLAPGKYIVWEISAPEAYVVSNEELEFEMVHDGITRTFYNEKKNNEPQTIDITGNKTWDDENDKDGIRPESITINLMINDEILESKTVTEDDGWEWSFENLDKYDSNGNEIKYSITEDAVAGYTSEVDGYNVTNTHVPNKPKNPLLRVTKEAVDLPRHIYPGDEIKYLIRVTNTGDGDANEILVMDIMGENLEYVEDDSDGTPEGRKVSWVVDIPAGKSKEIYITCRVKEGATGSVTNEVEISGIEDEYIESEYASDVEVLGEYKEIETRVLPSEKQNEKPKSTEVKAVDTGDESYLMIWIMILVSAISAVTYIRFRRNK